MMSPTEFISNPKPSHARLADSKTAIVYTYLCMHIIRGVLKAKEKCKSA